MDRIDPIRPRPPMAEPIPAIRRLDRSTDREQQQDAQQRKRRPAPPRREPPPDDGRPHIDVTV
jgi:hypothetical protein